MTRLMVAKDTPQIIESTLDEEDLVRICDEFGIPALIELELLGPTKRVIMGATILVALYEEVFKSGLRLLLPAIIAKLLQWYQVCPTKLVSNTWQLIMEFFYHLVQREETPHAKVFRAFF